MKQEVITFSGALDYSFPKYVIVRGTFYLNAEMIHHLKEGKEVYLDGFNYTYHDGDLQLGRCEIELIRDFT